MKKLIAFVLALALAGAGIAQAQSFNRFLRHHLTPQRLPALEFIGCATEDVTDTGTYTFAATNVGTESPYRYTIVGIVGEDAAQTFNVSSVTIGGFAATELADSAGASTALGAASIYIQHNPVGSSESVVVTWSEAITGMNICIWSLTYLSDGAPETAMDASGAGAATLTSFVNQPFSVNVGICIGQAAASIAWTGALTESFDTAGAEFTYSGATFTEDGSPTSGNIVCTPNTGGGAVAAVGFY